MYIERMRVLHDLALWLLAGGMLIWSLHLWSKGKISPGDVILTVAVSLRILQGSRDLAFAVVNATQFISRIADALHVIGEDHKVVDGRRNIGFDAARQSVAMSGSGTEGTIERAGEQSAF
jgi:ATP-binding cassette subfamily B protein